MRKIAAGLLFLSTLAPLQAGQDSELKEQARKAMKKAISFYRSQVAVRGGYVYYTSLDLKSRWGEGKAEPEQIWVQPPGTPTVGFAFLRAYEATRDPDYLNAVRETAEALVYGQLASGGWTNHIDFNPKGGRVGKYRNGKGGSWNTSSLDDGQTQSALRFLMGADEALEFKDAAIHEAVRYGLEALHQAQFANGAFPQVWTGPVPAKPVVPASYPDYDWKTEGRVKNYWDLYTLNDGLAGTVLETLLEARRLYPAEKWTVSIEKLGDFLILAQMPDPQPAWAQQYTYEMRPAWARKFEPPAISGWESQDAMEALMRIAVATGKPKYLAPVSRAIAYLKKSLLPDGRLARFYELKSNKPLYMDAQYKLTYDDSEAPSHYGWKQPSRLDRIESALAAAEKGLATAPATRELEPEVRRIVSSLDDQGRWVSVYDGEPLVGQPKFAKSFAYLSSAVFSRNVETLSAYLASKAK
jgi:PelA/Pel-15E family pectate lyase